MNFKIAPLASMMILGISGPALAAIEPAEYSGHHIYVNANETLNKVIHYAQLKDGSLVEVSRIPTNGAGTGGYKVLTGQKSAPDNLVSAGAVAISPDNRWLFVVNAGDNSVSSFHLTEKGELQFIDRQNTQADGTASTVTYNAKKQILYVGHTFGPQHIKVFKVNDGKLSLIPGGHTVNTVNEDDRVLSQLQISPDNRFLLANVVYDKRPKKIDGKFKLWPSNNTVKDGLVVFPVLDNGDIGKPAFYDAGGESPFGLTFIDKGEGRFINTMDQDPGIAVLSKLNHDGSVTTLSSARAKVEVPGKEGIGTCWVSLSPDGKTAFVAGYDTGEVASFTVAANSLAFAKGRLATLEKRDLSGDPAALTTGSPVGNWVSSNGYLYQLYPSAAKLVAYKIEGTDLKRIESYAIPLNSPQGITGY
ncbi:TPA: beta-propeller fold lactonase family protein [Enterobacter hormaechei subsp. steigerwaltii]|nr:beta-propeller fold lactonase family protein [Enterobacter hormaechei subsp. steigerwaltii]